jgi:hypothetical protein
MRHRSLVSRALDHLDYVITYTRLRILDWIRGPEPPTPADEQRERDHEPLGKEILDVSVAEREAQVKPDSMLDDNRRKPVTTV